MSKKHYNSDYLTETIKILGGVKEKSYQFFRSIPAGGTIVDLGCGTGQDVLNMAKIFEANNYQLIGIDHDNEIIKRDGLIDLPDNVTFLVSDALHLPLKEKSVNGLRMERLVQHIPDPIGLFNEVQRVLENNGIVVVVESDWKSLSFYNGDLAIAEKLNDYLSLKKVNNGKVARSLTNYLQEVGFHSIGVEVQPFVLTNYKDACTYLWIDKMVDEMLTLQLIDQREHQDFIEAQLEADRLGFFSCSMNIVTVSAKT